MMSAVLVVDDQMDVCRGTASLLRLEGLEAACAAGGDEALDYVRRTPTRLVLLDVAMPGLSGWDVLRAIRSDVRIDRVPVIMHSGVDDPSYAALAASLGAQAFVISAETSVEQLVSLIERHAA